MEANEIDPITEIKRCLKLLEDSGHRLQIINWTVTSVPCVLAIEVEDRYVQLFTTFEHAILFLLGYSAALGLHPAKK